MKCYRKNGSDNYHLRFDFPKLKPSMKCYRKNGSDFDWIVFGLQATFPQ